MCNKMGKGSDDPTASDNEDAENWVQCDHCNKWRRIPATFAEQLADDKSWCVGVPCPVCATTAFSYCMPVFLGALLFPPRCVSGTFLFSLQVLRYEPQQAVCQLQHTPGADQRGNRRRHWHLRRKSAVALLCPCMPAPVLEVTIYLHLLPRFAISSITWRALAILACMN